MSIKIITKNKKTIFDISKKVILGKRIIFGPQCRSISIGYGSYLGDDVYIDVPELSIGEYTTIHKNTTIHGYKPCHIGHNCWIGQFSIIDSVGDCTIGNNVGIGAHSQLWSHIKFGDTLQGCRWNSEKHLLVEDDVWFVGHCIVSPITAAKRSMLLVGGVATKNMEENHVYAGIPAKDVTDKFGAQFSPVNLKTLTARFETLKKDFYRSKNINPKSFRIETVNNLVAHKSTASVLYVDLKKRLYSPCRSENEYKFMKHMLYDKAKFLPIIAEAD